MEVRKCYSKSLTLTALLLLLTFACFAQQEMRISHVGGYTVPYLTSNTVRAMQGDSLAFYDFSLEGRTINIHYGAVSPTGVVLPRQTIFSYSVPAIYGEIWSYPLFFEFKNGKLYSAFDVDSLLIVLFSTPQSTEIHFFDRTEIQYLEAAHIIDETEGYVSCGQYPNPQSWVCRMDFESHTLPLFYQPQSMPHLDRYNFLPVLDEYLLMWTGSDDYLPDILVRDGEIVQIIPGNWSGEYTAGYTYTQKLCGNHFYTLENSMVYTSDSIIGWVENNSINQYVFSPGYEDWEPDKLVFCEPQSDSTFTCVYWEYPDNSSFRNYRISNHTLIEDDFYPNLSGYLNGAVQFRMDEDYLVGIADAPDGNCAFILVDYPQQSIRSYEIAITDYMYWQYNHSDRVLYWLGMNGRVHIFRLEMALDAEDELLPPVSAILKAYPNPFRSTVSVQVGSDRQTDASLGVYNLRGQLVKSLHQGTLNQGESSFNWDGRDAHGKEVSAGLYLLRLDSEGKKQSTKLVHIK